MDLVRSSSDLLMIGDRELRRRLETRRRRETTARDMFLTGVLAGFNNAVADGDWDRAWRLASQARENYPDSPVLDDMVRNLREAGAPVAIDLANVSGQPITVSLLRQGGTAAVVKLPIKGRQAVDLAPGRYNIHYGAENTTGTDAVEVVSPQEWQISAVTAPRGRPPRMVRVFEREARDLDTNDVLVLRARMRKRESGPPR
jgi:hypothetical protein